MRWWLIVALAGATGVGILSCGADDVHETAAAASGTGASGGGGSGGVGGTPLCGSANLALDESALVEIGYDDDSAAHTNIRDQTYAITTTQQWVFNDVPLHEAVRFQLDHPAIVHGFKVKWAALPPGVDPNAELSAGLYRDFGYNGFDFWAPDPLWTGTRCAMDVDDSGVQWTTYAFDTPVTVDHPGLVYVAHRADPGTPVWWYDDVTEGANPDNLCEVFSECQSAFNLPEADANQFFNGLSFPFQYHFAVRLLVEYTDAVQPADTFFQPAPSSPTSGHVAWGDYDNDGYDDLLLGNGLWKNNGDGTFSDVTAMAGTGPYAATSGVFGDYDNDGCLDLFLFSESYANPDTLLHNECDGTFTAPANTGIVDQQSYETCGDPANSASPTASAAWVDIDADGLLDLYLANFICWSKETYYKDTVFMNDGDGTFTEVSEQNGFSPAKRASRAVAPIDHDGDGDIDIAVGNYRLQANMFFDNVGSGSVLESGAAKGLAGMQSGFYYGHTIGLAWGDLDGDGDFDQVVGNLAHPRFFGFSSKTEVLLNDGNGSFTNAAGDWTLPVSDAGLRYQETHSVPVLFDADNDGALDLAITCVYDGRPSDFYWGNGDGTFRLDAYHAGITTEDGWGVAVADFDHDGDMDLFADQLFVNELPAADKGHWLQARVVGVTANRAAIGATVRVTAGSATVIRHVQGATGKGGQDSLYLHFGLGSATSVDSITVELPGGTSVSYPGPIAVDQRVWLYENSTTAMPGWTAPQGF